MADTLKCPKCGEENPKTNRFCDSCGSKLNIPAVAAPAREDAAKPGDKKKFKTLTAKEEKDIRSSKFIAFSDGTTSADLAPSTGGIVINWEIIAWLVIIIGAFAIRFIRSEERRVGKECRS